MALSAEYSRMPPIADYVFGPRIPRELAVVVEGLAREILRQRPDDIYAFAARHFEQLIRLRETHREQPRSNGEDPLSESKLTCNSRGSKTTSEIEAEALAEKARSRSRNAFRRSGWSFESTVKALMRTGVHERGRSVLEEGTTDVDNVQAQAPSRSETDTSKDVEKHEGAGRRKYRKSREEMNVDGVKFSSFSTGIFVQDVERDLEKPQKTVVALRDRSYSNTTQRREKIRRYLQRSNTWDETFGAAPSRNQERSVNATFLPVVRSAPCSRLLYSSSRGESSSDMKCDSRGSLKASVPKINSRNSSSFESYRSAELTLPPILKDDRKSIKGENTLMLPALSISATTRKSGQLLDTKCSSSGADALSKEFSEVVRPESSLESPRIVETLANLYEVKDNKFSTHWHLDHDVDAIAATSTFSNNPVEIFENSLNGTPIETSDGLTPRAESLETPAEETNVNCNDNVIEARRDANELRNKLIELETVEKSVEKALLDSRSNVALELELSDLDSMNFPQRKRIAVETPPFASSLVTNALSPVVRQSTEFAGNEEIDAIDVDDGAEHSDVNLLTEITPQRNGQEKDTQTSSRCSPFSYVLTEGSPYEIPESVVAVIIPEEPVKDETYLCERAEENRDADGNLLRHVVDIFGVYVPFKNSCGDTYLSHNDKSIPDKCSLTMTPQDLANIKEEEEDAKEEEEVEWESTSCQQDKVEKEREEEEGEVQEGDYIESHGIVSLFSEVLKNSLHGQKIGGKEDIGKKAKAEKSNFVEVAVKSQDRVKTPQKSKEDIITVPVVPKLNLNPISLDSTISSSKESKIPLMPESIEKRISLFKSDGTMFLQESMVSEEAAIIEQQNMYSTYTSILKSNPNYKSIETKECKRTIAVTSPHEHIPWKLLVGSNFEEKSAKELIEAIPLVSTQTFILKSIDDTEESMYNDKSTINQLSIPRVSKSPAEDRGSNNLSHTGLTETPCIEQEIGNEVTAEDLNVKSTNIIAHTAARKIQYCVRDFLSRRHLRLEKHRKTDVSNVANRMNSLDRKQHTVMSNRGEGVCSKERDTLKEGDGIVSYLDSIAFWHTGEYHDSLTLPLVPAFEMKILNGHIDESGKGEESSPADSVLRLNAGNTAAAGVLISKNIVLDSDGKNYKNGMFGWYPMLSQSIKLLWRSDSIKTYGHAFAPDHNISSLLLCTIRLRLPASSSNLLTEYQMLSPRIVSVNSFSGFDTSLLFPSTSSLPVIQELSNNDHESMTRPPVEFDLTDSDEFFSHCHSGNRYVVTDCDGDSGNSMLIGLATSKAICYNLDAPGDQDNGLDDDQWIKNLKGQKRE